jgi:hypothetical protein
MAAIADASAVQGIIYDSGASHHILWEKKRTLNLRPSSIEYVQTGGGEQHKVQGEGEAILQGGPDGRITLRGVLLVPTMHANLLSGPQVDAAEYVVEQRAEVIVTSRRKAVR